MLRAGIQRALVSNAYAGGGISSKSLGNQHASLVELKATARTASSLIKSTQQSSCLQRSCLYLVQNKYSSNKINLSIITGSRANHARFLSSSTNGNNVNNEPANDKETTTNSVVLTPGQKVVQASRSIMYLGIVAFGSLCAYYIIKELMPTKMSPNRVFDRSFELVRADPEVKRRYGDSIKAYGRDHGGHREGRRNFIEHTEYTDAQDGSKRTRVRYNLEGRFGQAFVFAEVSSDMPSGEFVYVLVQDKSNGRVHTVLDNRSALASVRAAGGNKEAQSAMAQLLSGSGSK